MLHSVHLFPNQLLLLKAALLPPAEALSYWQAYRQACGLSRFSSTDPLLLPRLFDPVSWDSQRLMPMIFRNLEHTDDALIPHLRGYYRNTWMKNQRLQLKMQEVTGCLNEAGIESIMLKGMPLSLRYYNNMGIRLMSDLDVLVPTHRADDACRIVQQPPLNMRLSQFEIKHRRLLHATHSWDTNGLDVDIHWNLLSQHAYPGADAPFWRDRQPVTLPNGTMAYTLSPTHQLFHVLVHGSPLWYRTPPLRWIPDSLVICRHSDQAIDWSELTELARHYRLTIPIQQELRLLVDTFDLTLPDSMHRWLQDTRLDPAEETYFSMLSARPSTLAGKANRFISMHRMMYSLFRKGKPGPSFGRWLYWQTHMRYDWRNHDLPFNE